MSLLTMVVAATTQGQPQDASRLVESAVLLLTLGPGLMALFSGLIGAASYWTSVHASDTRRADLAHGINTGLAVGFLIGFPAGLLVAFARITNLIGSGG